MLRWTDAQQIRWLTMDPGTAAVIERHQADPQPDLRDPTNVIRIARTDSAAVLNGVGAHLYLEHEGAVLLGKRHPSCAYAPRTRQPRSSDSSTTSNPVRPATKPASGSPFGTFCPDDGRARHARLKPIPAVI